MQLKNGLYFELSGGEKRLCYTFTDKEIEEFVEELIGLSKNVSDSYPDFIIGVESAMKKNPIRIEELKGIIKENPEITTSDVVSGFL